MYRYIDPHLREKLEQGQAPEISYFYRDQRDSLQLIADATGGEKLERVYQPFGVETEYVVDPAALPEDFGFIDERRDKAAGLPLVRFPRAQCFVHQVFHFLASAPAGEQGLWCRGQCRVSLRLVNRFLPPSGRVPPVFSTAPPVSPAVPTAGGLRPSCSAVWKARGLSNHQNRTVSEKQRACRRCGQEQETEG